MSENFQRRTELFDLLVNYFPDHMTQPKENLLDLIPLDWRQSLLTVTAK